ncbi:hypothetical protein ACWI58_001371 [Vibrio fluvialis]
MESELFGVILGAMGSIASLVSLIFSFGKIHESKVIPLALILILGLTASSSYFSYQYYEVTQPEYIHAKKMEQLRDSARSFIKQYPSYRDYWDEGANEGIAKSGLLVLEVHKELFPETYESMKNDIKKDIDYSKQYRDQSGQRQALENVAQAVYSTMKTLAGS